jgi:hypothetical protein
MTELIPEAMKHPDPASGLTASGRPVTGTTDAAPAPIQYSTLTSPDPRWGASSFQQGFESIPVDPHDSGGPA